jgi:hypothetical protein
MRRFFIDGIEKAKGELRKSGPRLTTDERNRHGSIGRNENANALANSASITVCLVSETPERRPNDVDLFD